ncbi:alpha/beta fold hydrolase [Reyranella soli]|uniref:2-hydroxy-6-oxo-6-phenylhexa-2,4-dienoate hydrolase n=1 Tax=Reyranella soli TaxID=1230389 RepID=A0A512NPW0_9HYPH|nr:alpha/beta hydrolase [Reyranella soli]GEP60984.1 2-hydroxy-6-oxo-6-phenylhexa-2,4-dienoate hydrolase [Reyranella soli]
MQCETEKATINYEEHGEGRPILLLHGWTMDRRVEIFDYEKIFATRPGWRRIYPDLPGMGRSVAKDSLKSQDDVLDALLAFVDQVLPARFVLAGTSLGAYLARAVAARRRSRIAGLLLRVPCIFAEDARRALPPFQALVADDAFMASLDADDRTNLGDLLIQTPAYAESLKHKRDAVVQPAIQATAPIANEMRADPKRYGFSFDLVEVEKTFEEPTLIIAGRRDTTVGYRDAWSILDSYPRATFVALDRADHGWPMETPNLLPALIDDWLARIALAERRA